MPTDFTVTDEADLQAAIDAIDVGGTSAAPNMNYTITFAPGLTTADPLTLTSPLHAINLSSNDTRTIAQVEVERVTYWHVELDAHDILLAENLACESYLEMGNRAFFAEAGVVALGASPDAPATPTQADFCRPYHATGPLVDALRARLRRTADGCSRPAALENQAERLRT